MSKFKVGNKYRCKKNMGFVLKQGEFYKVNSYCNIDKSIEIMDIPFNTKEGNNLHLLNAEDYFERGE